MNKTKLKKIGGLWKIKNGVSGVVDFGIIGKKRIVILKNLKKREGSKQPDYNFFIEEEIIDLKSFKNNDDSKKINDL